MSPLDIGPFALGATAAGMEVAAALVAGLGAGVLAGLASTPHCMGMCGPLASATCGSGGALRRGAVGYQSGRMVSYGLAGGLAGALSERVVAFAAESSAAKAVGAVALALFALFALRTLLRSAGRNQGGTPTSADLVPLRRREDARGPLETTTAPSRRRLNLLRRPVIVGLGSVFLPCGALYAMFALAAASGSPAGGVGLGLGFAAASGLGLALSAFAGAKLHETSLGRGLLGAVIIASVAAFGLRLASPSDAAPCHDAPPSSVATSAPETGDTSR